MKKGQVIKSTGSWYTIFDGKETISCKIKGSFRVKGIRNTNPVAVGDIVHFEKTGINEGLIYRLEERKNYIIRKSTNLSKESHILAANIDQALLIVTLKFPETPFEFIDRFLLSAEAYHIKTILLINKMDLYNEELLKSLKIFKRIYEYAGYECIAISVKNGYNISQIGELLKDKLSLIAGNSGVGKSSLINLLCPKLNLKTEEISAYHHTGKHATTYPEMFQLPQGGFIIDTPGIRGYGIIDIAKNEIGLYFTDIFKLSKDCQFANCTHIHEPGCAVIQAYQSGILHQSRYRSYLKIFSDTNQKYRTG